MKTVFFRSYDNYEGIGSRLYRSCGEIRQDMDRIKERIEEAVSMLNIRNMLTEAMARYAESQPEVWIPELENLVSQANETLGELVTLRDNLDTLRCELEDTRWALGV